MSSVIGALRVNLGLDSAKFVKGARGVKAPLAAMKKQFVAVTAVAAAMGAAISTMALKGAQDIDRAAKASRRLGTSVLGFRALEMAAGEAGVSLSALTNDVQTMDREIARGSKNAVAALDRLGLSAQELDGLEADQKVALIADRVQALGMSSGEASALLQDLGVRNREMVLAVLSGGDAFRQARKDAEDYGLAISATDSAAIEQANDRIGRLGYIGQYAGQQLALELVPAMGRLAKAMTDSLREGGLLRGMIDGLVGNIQRLGTYLAVVVAGFGVRYVAALALATASTFTFAGALKFLRTALIRSGIGLLVVAAGEMVYQFSKLVTAAGGFGNAMKLLLDVAVEVAGRIGTAFDGAVFKLRAVWIGIRASAVDAFAGVIEVALGAVNKIVGAFVGAYDAVVAAWEALPDAFRRIGALAVNGLIDMVGTGIGGLLAPLNAVLEKTGNTPIPPPNLDSWKQEVGAAVNVAGKAKSAFDAAFGVDYTNASGAADAARKTAAGLEDASTLAGELGDIFLSYSGKPLESLKAIREVMTAAAEKTGDGADAAARLAALLGDAGASGGGAVGGVTDKVNALKGAAEDMKGTFKTAFKDAAKGAKSFGDIVMDVLNKIADRLLDSAFENLWSGLSGGGTGGGIGGFFSNILGGLFGSAKGNVFSHGSPVKAFANGGVVNSPTLFPMRGRQTGLMGEAGPEAIVPLSRGSDGKLGIKSQGGGTAAVQVIGGDLTLTDNGAIMARVQVMDAQTVSKSVGAAQASFRNSKSGWSP